MKQSLSSTMLKTPHLHLQPSHLNSRQLHPACIEAEQPPCPLHPYTSPATSSSPHNHTEAEQPPSAKPNRPLLNISLHPYYTSPATWLSTPRTSAQSGVLGVSVYTNIRADYLILVIHYKPHHTSHNHVCLSLQSSYPDLPTYLALQYPVLSN